jgi:glycosyltransferase involved in cell wall biosynthesis
MKAALSTQADLIHIAKPHPMNSVAGIVAKYTCRKPLFLDCDDYEAGSNRFEKQWQRWIVAFFEKFTPKHVEMISTNTHFMQDNLISWGVLKEKIVYLPNGIDPNRFPPPDLDAIENLRKQLNISDQKVVAYIGSISLTNHPIDLLLEAFPKVLQRVPDSKLMIVGGGEDLPLLKRIASKLEIQKHILFIGRVQPEEVYLFYGIADVVVDPVHDDDAARGRAPLKLLESWICRVPYVTADVGDRRKLLGEPLAGILVKPGDNNLLANEISGLLSKPQTKYEIRNLGQERVKLYYWKKLADSLSSKYSEFLNNDILRR